MSPLDYIARVSERDIQKLQLDDGSIPFDGWVSSLRDRRIEAAIDARLARVRSGNFGDHKRVGGGVSELRIDIGPGLRVYYGEQRQNIVILIGGGDKRTQTRDINRAKLLWQQWLKANNP